MNTRIDAIMSEIRGYQLLLDDSDYKAIKHSEGLIPEAEYAQTKAQREQWRAKINELEAELATLQADE